MGSLQSLQGRVLPASSSFWRLQASIPGLAATSLPSLPPSPRGFSSVSASLSCDGEKDGVESRNALLAHFLFSCSKFHFLSSIQAAWPKHRRWLRASRIALLWV